MVGSNMDKVRDAKTKQRFITFLENAPDLRFGQALVVFLNADIQIHDELSNDYLDIFYMEFDDLLANEEKEKND